MSATQGFPHPTKDYSDFPEKIVAAGEGMYRAHGHKGAWWFDNGSHGRFNLHGSRGTCCTATTVDTAVRERVRDELMNDGMVSAATAASFVVSIVTAPIEYRCAAVSSTPAATFGVIRELTTMHDYAIPQAFASTFDASRFGGVFYASAYTSGDASAYALFGEHGAPADPGYAETRHMTGEEACAAVGVAVRAPATLRGMRIIR